MRVQEFKQTEIGRMPKEWEMVSLKEIAEINRESIDPPKEFPNNRFLYIDIDSVENETAIIRNPKEIIGRNAPSRARRLIHQNDVLMSTVRPYLKAFAIVPKEFHNQICSTGFAVLTSTGKIAPLFLLYVLFTRFVIGQLKRTMVGGQYPALNTSQLASIKLPLPPLPEQKKIAEILSTVDQAIEKVSEAIKKTHRLKKGLMQELLTIGIGHKEFKDTKIGRIPKEWEVTKLGEIAELKNGINFAKEQKGNDGVLTIDVLNMYGENIYLNLGNLYRVNILLNDRNYLLKKGDILFVRSSLKKEGAGWASLFNGFTEPITFCGFIIRARLKDNNTLPDFLTHFLRSNISRNKLIASSGQVAITNITQEMITNLNIPILPLSEQEKIIGILSTLEKRIELLRKKKEMLGNVKKGLMADLLTGKKRVRLEV